MPRAHREIHTDTPPHRVHAYLADFTNATEWDHGTVSCELVEGAGSPGSVYRNVRAAPDAPPAWRDFTATHLHNPTAEWIGFQLYLRSPAAHLQVDVEPMSIRPIFTNLPLREDGGLTLRYHTGRILCFDGSAEGETLVIYGRPGEVGELELGLAAGSWAVDGEA